MPLERPLPQTRIRLARPDRIHLSGPDPARQPLGPRHVGGMTRRVCWERSRPSERPVYPAADALEAFDDAVSERARTTAGVGNAGVRCRVEAPATTEPTPRVAGERGGRRHRAGSRA